MSRYTTHVVADPSQIDRRQRYYKVPGLHLPHWENRDEPLTDTLIDGELVYDIDPNTKKVGTVTL